MEASRERGLTRTPLPAPTLAALERHLFEVRPEDLSLVGSLPFFSSSQNELFEEQFEFLVCFVLFFCFRELSPTRRQRLVFFLVCR